MGLSSRSLPVLVCAGVLTVLAFTPRSFSQTEIRFERFMLASGISDLTINDITQDSTGYLWVATRNGLNRYDGARFKVFRNIPGDSASLTHDNVQKVFVDSRGTVWIGTWRGLCKFNPLYQNFQRYVINGSSGATEGSEDINAIVEDSSGVLWIGIAGGGVARMARSETFTRYTHNPLDAQSLSSNAVRCLLIDTRGFVWAGTTDKGLNRINPLSGKVEHFIHDPDDTTTVGGTRIEALGIDAVGNVLVGTQGGGLNLFDPVTRSFTRFTNDARNTNSISSNWVSCIFRDRSRMLWLGTQGGGVNVCDSSLTTFRSFTTDHLDRFSISDDYCQSIFQDRTGEIWIGTGSGLNKVLRHSSVFRHVSNKPGEEKLLASVSVSAALKDHTRILWVGSSRGLTRIVEGAGGSRHYLDNLNADDQGVRALVEDRHGSLWIGTSTGIFRMNRTHPFDERPTFKQLKHDPANPRSLRDDDIWSMYEDRSGTLWVGGVSGGLSRFDHATETWTNYSNSPDDPVSISSNSITCFYEDHNGVLWVGTMRGLNMFNAHSETFTSFLPEASNANSLPSNAVFGISEDRKRNLWIATARGLSVLDTERRQFHNYLTEAGLPDVFLKGIVADTSGIMWISSRSGLTQAREDSNGKIRFTNYGESEGLPVLDFNPLSFSSSSDGEIMFGSGNGVIRFYPDQLRMKRDPPALAITAFKVFDKERPMLSGLELMHYEYHISIEFSAFDFASPERQQFQYMIDGLDNAWLNAGHARSALYANLAPGSYTFRVRGTNGDGLWSRTDAAYSFTILPPYWQTWWFRILVILAIAFMVYSVYRYRLNRLLEVERLRLRLASDLHDELASNLSSIAMFGEIIRDESARSDRDPQQHAMLLNRITTLAQESVHSIRDIIWALDPKPETLHDLLIRVHDSTIAACNAKNIKLRFAMPDKSSLPVADLPPEVRKNLSLLMKEIINNAVKHSICTELAVEPHWDGQTLTVKIQDNGKGFNAASPHSGKGLRTMRARARELGNDFAIHSEAGKGTLVQFTATLP